jgi:hypothetical protein
VTGVEIAYGRHTDSDTLARIARESMRSTTLLVMAMLCSSPIGSKVPLMKFLAHLGFFQLQRGDSLAKVGEMVCGFAV